MPNFRPQTGTRFSFAAEIAYADRVPASPDAPTQLPAIDGWLATDDSGVAHLIGGKCPQCGTYVFPPRANNCPNPGCDGDELDQVPLSRRGTVWSYTENRYAPPPPYPSPDPFEPFAVAAVELADEGLIVLGKVVEGTLAADLKVGMEMELTTMPLYTDDDGVERIVYAWRIADNERWHAGTGLHPRCGHAPVGQVGPRLHRVRRGRRPRRAGRRRPGLAPDPAGRRRGHHPQRLPRLRRRARPSPRSWAGTASRSSSSYAACAIGLAGAADAPAPRSWPGCCDVALVIGADTTPKGFFAPVGGERRNDPDWQRFHLIGATNTVYFALLARRRMDLYGATLEDFAAVKVKNCPPRPEQPERPLPQGEPPSRTCWPARWSPTRCGCSTSAPPPTAPPR